MKEAKEKIKKVVSIECEYNLDRTYDEVKNGMTTNYFAAHTVPEAIICFLESKSYEDAIRKAACIGGDSDTITAITGGIAEAFYGDIPKHIRDKALSRLPKGILDIVKEIKNQHWPLTDWRIDYLDFNLPDFGGKHIDNCGGMSADYSVREPSGRLVWIKALKAENKDDRNPDSSDKIKEIFRREYEIIKDINHPNIIKYLGAEFDNDFYIKVQYLVGYKNLSEVMEDRCLSDKEKDSIVSQLMDTMIFLHSSTPDKYPIVHCDLKPDNIMISPEGFMKLIDFGAAVSKEFRIVTPVRTEGFCAPEYCPLSWIDESDCSKLDSLPDQNECEYDEREPDVRWDIYSLGKILESLDSEHYASVIEKATKHYPEDRFQSVIEMREAFKSLVFEES